MRALDEAPPFGDQDDDRATYAEKIGPADRRLDPGRTAVELERTVRALTPAHRRPPRRGRPTARRAGRPRALRPGAPEGELATQDGRLLLGCEEGALELLEVLPAGGRPMSAADYLRGRPQRRG